MITPAYVYDLDLLKARIRAVREALPGIPLAFSVKANSFITAAAAGEVSHVEVCSPGELRICETLGVAPEQIIYSGVVKGAEDLREAIRYGAGLLTAESPSQFRLLCAAAAAEGKRPKVLLRLSSDNQFGMDPEDLLFIARSGESCPEVCLWGVHYYSGTQKKKPEQIAADLERLSAVLERCEKECGWKPELVEYGPGLAVEYFKENGEEADLDLLARVAPLLREFALRYPLGIEMGRFMAAPCGSYYTSVKDLKTSYGIRYAMLDGGIHHLKYYGQIMAMHVPPIVQHPAREGEEKEYCLCGSLCTVADVLAKNARLRELETGDVLEFRRCGAYSLTEASSLFLSRDLPAVYLREGGKDALVRGAARASDLNTVGYGLNE